MSRRLQRGLWLCGLLTLIGCGDSADSLLRTGINCKSELTDRLSKVTDEPSARNFIDQTLKVYTDKNKALSDKWDKWIKEIEDDPYRGKVRVVNITSSGPPRGPNSGKRTCGPPRTRRTTRHRHARGIHRLHEKRRQGQRFDREKARITDLVIALLPRKRPRGATRPIPRSYGPTW